MLAEQAIQQRRNCRRALSVARILCQQLFMHLFAYGLTLKQHESVMFACRFVCGNTCWRWRHDDLWQATSRERELLAFVWPANRLGNCCAAVKCNFYIRTRSMAAIKPTHTYTSTPTTNKRKLNVNHKNVNEKPLIKLRVFRCSAHTHKHIHKYAYINT